MYTHTVWGQFLFHFTERRFNSAVMFRGLWLFLLLLTNENILSEKSNISASWGEKKQFSVWWPCIFLKRGFINLRGQKLHLQYKGFWGQRHCVKFLFYFGLLRKFKAGTITSRRGRESERERDYFHFCVEWVCTVFSMLSGKHQKALFSSDTLFLSFRLPI